MTTILPARYWLAPAAVLGIALLLLSGWPASGYEYRTARALFHDCSTARGSDRWKNCAESLHVLYNNWQLEQGDRVCSRPAAKAPRRRHEASAENRAPGRGHGVEVLSA